MTTDRPDVLTGLAVVGLGVCCGLPVVLGAGALSDGAGLATGSAALVVVGVLLAVVGVTGRRHRRRDRPIPDDESTAHRPGGR